MKTNETTLNSVSYHSLRKPKAFNNLVKINFLNSFFDYSENL